MAVVYLVIKTGISTSVQFVVFKKEVAPLQTDTTTGAAFSSFAVPAHCLHLWNLTDNYASVETSVLHGRTNCPVLDLLN